MSDIDDLLDALEGIMEDMTYNKIKYFEPDTWQKKAIALGKDVDVRGVLAANRIGKSYLATYEASLHLTGLYPDDWGGYRFDKPINCLALGESWSQLMNSKAIQDLFLGPMTARGTGWIPQDKMRNSKGAGVLGAVAYVEVEHVSGGYSTLKFGTYQSGDETLMGSSLDFVLIDECPSDKNILPQVVKRTWTTKGKVLCSFTPEKGLNDTVAAFWEEDGIYHNGLVHATLFDSMLYTESERQRMIESIPPWQRNFSIYGRPSAGHAAVFSGINKSDIVVPTPDIPDHWKRLCSIDFGYRDPTAILFIALDHITGTYYVYDEVFEMETDIHDIAPKIVSRQHKYIPMVYPADGLAERGLGTTFIKMYEECGVIITDKIAANWEFDQEGKDRSISTGIIHIRNLMKDRKLFIDPKCVNLLKEFDLYSYNDHGKFIDKDNHFIDSMRYNIMSLKKFGVSEKDGKNPFGGEYIPEYPEWM